MKVGKQGSSVTKPVIVTYLEKKKNYCDNKVVSKTDEWGKSNPIFCTIENSERTRAGGLKGNQGIQAHLMGFNFGMKRICREKKSFTASPQIATI